MIWLKFVHIAAISLWSALLICLPALYVQRVHVANGPALHRLHAMARYIYVGILSPAAFVAVASGTALIFTRGTFEPWFSLKLLFVGAMAVIHILTGLVIIRLFDEGEVYPVWRFVLVTALTLSVVILILFTVLAKPEVPDVLPDALSEPGALRRLLLPLIPFLKS